MDFSGFPHPDKHYPHPMEQWPEEVVAPVSIVLGEDSAEIDEVPRYTLYPDPQNARTIAEPTCTITMPNGATLTAKIVGDPEGGNSEEIFTGDWEVYLGGLDRFTRGLILDTAYETIQQAQK